mmetsp:Transcript_37845/g.67611  ORF Transcript_37845/g.67611 Transcript_37845/m.67611 type:complete len:548 (-) Transcript_37845:162-1805(-)
MGQDQELTVPRLSKRIINLEGLDGWARMYAVRCNVHQTPPNSRILEFFMRLTQQPWDEPITRLDLADNYLGKNGFMPLLEILAQWPDCKTLVLRNMYLDTRNVIDFCNVLGGHPTLAYVDMSKNPLYDTGGRHLLALVKKNRKIVELNLEGTEIKESYMGKINTQVRRNLIKQPIRLPIPKDIMDHLPELPLSPTPFARNPALAPNIHTLFSTIYCKEVDDHGGTPFSEQRRRMNAALGRHGKLAVQLLTDFGFPVVGALERLGHWIHGFDAIRKETQRLTKEFTPFINADPILRDEIEHLHAAIDRESTPEIIMYLWPLRAKCLSFRRSNQAVVAAVDGAVLQLKATLLKKREARLLTYIVDKITYLPNECAAHMAKWMTPEPVGPPGWNEWDWYLLVENFRVHYEESAIVTAARAPIMDELLPMLPICVKDYLLYLCLADLNPAAPADHHPKLQQAQPPAKSATGHTMRYKADFLQVVVSRLSTAEGIDSFCDEWAYWVLVQSPEYIEASVEAVADWHAGKLKADPEAMLAQTPPTLPRSAGRPL